MSSSPLLSGPSDIPAGARFALVCLHGFGDAGQSWLDVLSLMKGGLPQPLRDQLAFFCPNAPDPTPFGEGLQWFRDNGWTFRDPPGLARAADLVAEYLTRKVEGEHQIPRERTILMGFSQGAMVTLYTVPRLNPPVAAHISLAGHLTETRRPDPLTHTRTLMLHGLDDDVLPADASIEAERIYRDWGMPVELELIPGLGHGADARALAHIAAFVQEVLK